MKILITSGGTKIPIDRVRSITNMSKGTFGSRIADALVDRFIINMDKSTEITTKYKDSPHGLLSYERNLGIYSMKIGQLLEKKQIQIINKLTKKLIDEFVPFSTWDSHN